MKDYNLNDNDFCDNGLINAGSLFSDINTLDPMATTRAWEKLDQSLIADALTTLPLIMHTSLVCTLKKKISQRLIHAR